MGASHSADGLGPGRGQHFPRSLVACCAGAPVCTVGHRRSLAAGRGQNPLGVPTRLRYDDRALGVHVV